MSPCQRLVSEGYKAYTSDPDKEAFTLNIKSNGKVLALLREVASFGQKSLAEADRHVQSGWDHEHNRARPGYLGVRIIQSEEKKVQILKKRDEMRSACLEFVV